jgi:hypothetical protein
MSEIKNQNDQNSIPKPKIIKIGSIVKGCGKKIIIEQSEKGSVFCCKYCNSMSQLGHYSEKGVGPCDWFKESGDMNVNESVCAYYIPQPYYLAERRLRNKEISLLQERIEILANKIAEIMDFRKIILEQISIEQIIRYMKSHGWNIIPFNDYFSKAVNKNDDPEFEYIVPISKDSKNYQLNSQKYLNDLFDYIAEVLNKRRQDVEQEIYDQEED